MHTRWLMHSRRIIFISADVKFIRRRERDWALEVGPEGHTRRHLMIQLSTPVSGCRLAWTIPHTWSER